MFSQAGLAAESQEITGYFYNIILKIVVICYSYHNIYKTKSFITGSEYPQPIYSVPLGPWCLFKPHASSYFIASSKSSYPKSKHVAS